MNDTTKPRTYAPSKPADQAPAIELTPVESSQLAAFGWDADSQTLAIRFHGKDGKPGLFGLLALDNQCQAFLFTKAADHLATVRDAVVGQGAKHVVTLVEVRAHAAQQSCQGGFAGHGVNP